MTQLKTRWSPELAESLDHDFQRALIAIAKKCRKVPNLAYTKQIADLRAKKNILYRIISQMRNIINMSGPIEFILHQETKIHIPSTIKECQNALWRLQKEIRNLE